MAKVFQLAPHEKMTPEQTLAFCARECWKDILIIGFQNDADGVVIRSSDMSRELANWLVDHAKKYCLDQIK
jgi:hypothetical protein